MAHRIITSEDFLRIGLVLSGFGITRQLTVEPGTNVRRFKSHYGPSPVVCAAIWADLLAADKEACIVPVPGALDKFFLCLNFLKTYATEEKLSGFSKLHEKTARKWAWFFVSKLQALKAKKILWPQAWTTSTAPGFWYSVDGVHCRANEIIHPTLAKNSKLYSHKFNQAGFGYEIALSLSANSIVWINGPFLGSKHDVTIFRHFGLKDKMPSGKKGIADNGYRGERGILCTPSSHDSAELRKFKTRARARHETLNSRIKNFGCLDQRFRHGMAKHKICFEAVCVIVQYELENGSPLFDI